MPRTKNFGRKPGYFEKLKAGTSHPTYDPTEEGYGNASEWASIFNVVMGFKEAQAHKASRGWKSDWKVIGDIAEIHIDENSMWDEIRKAFRRAAMNCHPDRISQHGKNKIVHTYKNGAGQTVNVTQAEAEFKDITAAYTMLEDVYRTQGRLK